MLSLIVTLLPTILELVGRALKSADASDALLAKFDDLVKSSQDEGLISENTKIIFQSQKDELQKQLDADAQKAAKP